MSVWAKLYRSTVTLDLGHEPRRRRLVQQSRSWSSSRSGHDREQLEVEVAADDRRVGQHPPGVVAEPVDALADHLADALGESLLVEVVGGDPAAGRRPGGSRPDSPRCRSISVVKNGLPSVSRRTACASATPSSGISWPAAASIISMTSTSSSPTRSMRCTSASRRRRRQHVRERTARRQLRIAVGAQDHHLRQLVRPRDVAQQLQGRPVGPVEIIRPPTTTRLTPTPPRAAPPPH